MDGNDEPILGHTKLDILKQARPAFFNPAMLPWTPWVMEGTNFKLLNFDKKTGGFTILLKVDPDLDTPVHSHLGAVEGIVLEGEFGYDDDRGGVGSYFYEEAATRHQPDSPTGTIMFAVVHGPIVGHDEDGGVAGVVDARLMYELAAANGAADHLAHLADFPS
ncbi:2,4'-dihydroxyacetophenone dioxygenase family protein [Hyphococcus sp. DH-69]|uniref:2,4'-dihydroxyacetophenone dioxygenase family protein n=1 Tax=Hyphococcus formosus TaxID=3143534 RepID=UPI00398B8D2E